MEDSLKLLWYTFSAAWVAYLLFVVSFTSRQRDLGHRIRQLRTRLEQSQRDRQS